VDLGADPETEGLDGCGLGIADCGLNDAERSDTAGADVGGTDGAGSDADGATDIGDGGGDGGPAVVSLPEEVVPLVEPGCDDCFVAINETWDGEAEISFPTKGEYSQEYEGQMFYFRPWVRFRMPHPGKVKRLFVLSSGAGALEMRLSSGFPGGHYPCLDETNGEDRYPVGAPYVMETTAEPGWRVFDVSGAEHSLLGYDEFFVIFRQDGDARVGLYYPVPVAPGDYGVYGGLIADAPGDQMTCFPSMSNFTDIAEAPLEWVIRAEIEASEVVPDKGFEDGGADGLNVGGHASFGDYDNDGDEDLLSGGALWENDGNGDFTNATEGAGLATLGGETVWGDYDNDGNRDILGVGGKAMLFRNLGDGTFEDRTEESQIVINSSSQGVAWIDVNQDGYLDFYAASYGTLADPETPDRDYLFISNGDGTFYDFTEAAGIPVGPPKLYHGRGVCTADYDSDGDHDIYVGNYRLDPNQLWQNQGGLDGFVEQGWAAGVKGWFELGGYAHTIGPSFGDLDGDALIDILVPNLAHPRFVDFSDFTTLYFNNGDGTFEGIEAPGAGILYDETHSDSVLLDAENDGDLDVFLTSVYEGRRSYLYLNDGTGGFTDGTYEAGILHLNGWGAASGDVDGDGDQDLVAYRLFRNETVGGHYLALKLVGGATEAGPGVMSNRDAIGAVVEVHAGGMTLLRQVEGGTGTGCQNSSVLHFGLGAADAVDSIEVRWPSGMVQDVGPLPVDQLHALTEI